MKRRECLLAVWALLLSLPATAAEPRTIGIVALGPQSVFRELPTYAQFYARMRELGWREGQNIRYVGLGVGGDESKLDLVIQEHLRNRVAMIVTVGRQEALAAKRATATVPIVMVHPGDPVALGLVTSLSRPGGNLTGSYTPSLHAKRAELIAEFLPGARQLLLAYDPPKPSPKFVAEMAEAASRYRLASDWSQLPANGDYDAWVAKAKRDGFDTALVPHASSAFRPERRNALMGALIKHRLPALCTSGEYVESGCLASYGPSNIEFFATAAVYADKILRGAKPQDLPVQQPTTYEFVINIKTAKALGISIPPVTLLRATRVIE